MTLRTSVRAEPSGEKPTCTVAASVEAAGTLRTSATASRTALDCARKYLAAIDWIIVNPRYFAVGHVDYNVHRCLDGFQDHAVIHRAAHFRAFDQIGDA